MKLLKSLALMMLASTAVVFSMDTHAPDPDLRNSSAPVRGATSDIIPNHARFSLDGYGMDDRMAMSIKVAKKIMGIVPWVIGDVSDRTVVPSAVSPVAANGSVSDN